ncbi:AraC family transcriptional regulator [Pedobacter sp. UBA4863]|uniref:helix-turn-helix domain-containing protein n=1 Tax=Pedobacter sp. UBA4863 TaxID=1947060 RepID=UPI0025FFCE61|nr:AraC family transcriptional regulator [Pedobacter sp. UBA4863]
MLNSKGKGQILASEADRFKELKDYIDVNLQNDLTVMHLANLMGQSIANFKRYFIAVYGISPGKYVHDARMEKAHELLSQHTYQISEVSELVGYTDRTSFSRAFTKHFGYTPQALFNDGQSQF